MSRSDDKDLNVLLYLIGFVLLCIGGTFAYNDLDWSWLNYSEDVEVEYEEKSNGGVLNAAGKYVNAFGEEIGAFFNWKLPNGDSIDIPKGGFENKFLNALSINEAESGRHFIFDRVYFKTGSSELNANSENQISSILAILRAYPDFSVLLRGHTDNTGSAETNKKLSFERAYELKNQLVESGINESRLTVQGMGSSEPVADNSTKEGRSKNRRIDISVIR